MLFKVVAMLTLGWCLNLLIVDDKEAKNNLESLEDTFANIIIEQITFEELMKKEQIIDRDTIIIDLSSNFKYHFWISQLALRQNIPHILNDDFNNGYSSWTFSLKLNLNRYINSLVNTLKTFNWQTGVVFLSYKNSYLKEKINEIFDNDFHYIIVESQTDISQVIDREVFKLGSYLYYLFTESNISSKIIQNLIRTNLLSEDSGILLSQESSYNTDFDGALILSSKGQEIVKSYEEEIAQSIKNIISEILASENFKNSGNDINFIIKDILISICDSHFCTNYFNLVNIQSGDRVIIGDSLSIPMNNSIIFPGNSLKIPQSRKKIIKLSISDGSINPTTPAMPFTHSNYFGCYIAINQINSGQDLIENFILSPTTFDCGVTEYNASFMYNCFSKQFDDIGVIQFPSSFTPVVVGAMVTLARLNHSIPVIGGMAFDDILTLPQKYPFFSRTSFDFVYVTAQVVKILYTLGWRNCAVLYQVQPLNSAMYQQFVDTADTYNINILNREHLRGIPGNVNDYESLSNHTEIIQEVISSNARLLIMIMLADISIVTMDLFYDLGIRNGDLQVLWAMPAWINTVYVPRPGGLSLTKINQISLPAISMDQPSYIGDVGNWVETQLASTYGGDPSQNNIGSCWNYDAVRLGAYALDFMINRGLDYTNGTLLMEAVRKQIFTGCSGTVRIEPETNNRFINFLVLKNAVWNPATNSVDVSNAAYWNPTGSDILTILQPLVYAGNSTIKPSDFRIVLNNCPFPDKDIRTFNKGRYLVFGICITVAVATAVITIIIWEKWWNIRAEDLKERKEISVPDAIMAATIVVEFFQLLAMGPDITPINSLISDIGKSFSLDFESLIQVRNDVFWIFIDGVFGAIVLWVILSVIVLFRLDEIFRGVAIIRHLSSLSDYLMPVLGNLLFIPFISGLLDVFVCDKSIGDDFSQSFMYKDCNQFCWVGDHIIYAIFAFIGIILYEPLAIFCRPLWQEFQSLSHVKYSPRHLMLKTIFQITLIVMNKTIKRAQDIAHGAIFTFFVLIFAVFTHGHKAYNYPRFSWWLTLSLFGIVWESFLTTINIGIGNSDSIIWVIILIIGWIIIGITGVLVQRKKYPSLLFRSKGKDTTNLFKFAFSLTRGKSKVVSFK